MAYGGSIATAVAAWFGLLIAITALVFAIITFVRVFFPPKDPATIKSNCAANKYASSTPKATCSSTSGKEIKYATEAGCTNPTVLADNPACSSADPMEFTSKAAADFPITCDGPSQEELKFDGGSNPVVHFPHLFPNSLCECTMDKYILPSPCIVGVTTTLQRKPGSATTCPTQKSFTITSCD
jgi:hypothetical protein